MLMPETSLDAAKNVAERIRQQFAKGFKLPNGKNVTASLGVAEFNLQGSYMDFYKFLDAILYRTKNEEKNRFFVAE
jgi:PleD family two-component response regulator